MPQTFKVEFETKVESQVRTSTFTNIIQIGAAGRDGISTGGGGNTYVVTVDSPMSGNRVVLRRAGGLSYADASNVSHAGLTLGLTGNAASTGGQVSVLTFGEVTEPSWNWTLGQPIFLGLNGLMTQTPPALPGSAFAKVVAQPITAQSLFFDPQDSTVI